MNATMTPKEILPSMHSRAPTMHTITYPKLPMKFMNGIIMPPRNCDMNPDLNRLSLILSNSSLAAPSPQ